MIDAAKPLIGEAERAAVDRVLASGRVVQGEQVAGFEAEFADLVDGRPCVAVNSGTSALHLGLLAAGIGPGDEVIVPSFTFAATANAVRLAGAVPVFADIEPNHFGLDPDAVEAAVSPRTAAIMPVHLYGHPADMARLGAIAERHRLAIVEDACQAHAAALHGRGVGTFGTVAAFSFYPTKNMTAGEGGMVVLADDKLARKVRLLRNQGMLTQYENEVVGFNVRMTDIAAAIGRVQLGRLEEFTAARQANAAHLSARLTAELGDGLAGEPDTATSPTVGGVRLPTVADGATCVWHQYTVRVRDRDAVRTRLADAGVGSGVYYPKGVHALPAYDLADHYVLPETDRACAEVLSLPVHPALSASDLDQVAAALVKALWR